MQLFVSSEQPSSPIPEQNSSDSHTRGPTPRQMRGIRDTQGRIGITLSTPPLAPSPAPHHTHSAKSCWTGAALLPHRGVQPLISPALKTLYFFTLMLSSPSSLSMTLGTKMALSHSRLVPARKPSACQAPTRHRRASQSAREVLPFHGQSQNSHLIINHPD